MTDDVKNIDEMNVTDLLSALTNNLAQAMNIKREADTLADKGENIGEQKLKSIKLMKEAQKIAEALDKARDGGAEFNIEDLKLDNMPPLEDLMLILKNIRSMLSNKAEKGRKAKNWWKPKGGKYQIITAGEVGEIVGKMNYTDRMFGMGFKTLEEAKRAMDSYFNYHRLYKLQQQIDDGWSINWDEHNEETFTIAQSIGNGYGVAVGSGEMQMVGCVYFKSMESVEAALEIINSGRLFK